MSQLMLYKAASLKVSISIISTNGEETLNLVLQPWGNKTQF
jgi:hypothetical protein